MTLDELEAIAKAAQERNPGPWRRSRWNDDVVGDGRFDYIRDSSPKPDGFDDYDGGTWRGKTVLETDGGYYEPKEATAVHIATFSPDVVIKLLRVAKAAQEYREFADRNPYGARGDDELDAALEALGL